MPVLYTDSTRSKILAIGNVKDEELLGKSDSAIIAALSVDNEPIEIEISKGVIQSVIPITDELRKDSQFNVAALVAPKYELENKFLAGNITSGVLDAVIPSFDIILNLSLLRELNWSPFKNAKSISDEFVIGAPAPVR